MWSLEEKEIKKEMIRQNIYWSCLELFRVIIILDVR